MSSNQTNTVEGASSIKNSIVFGLRSKSWRRYTMVCDGHSFRFYRHLQTIIVMCVKNKMLPCGVAQLECTFGRIVGLT